MKNISSAEKLWLSVASKVRFVPFYEFDHNIHISLKNKFLYVETPKVACSTLKLTLARLELEDESYNRENIHDRNVSPLLRASQVGDFNKFLNREEIVKFCFVRNPYERLLSCYLDKVRGRDKATLSGLLCQLGLDQTDYNQEISFEKFLCAVGETPLSMMNSHWRPQYYQTFQGVIQFDRIGKLERFEKDLFEIGMSITRDFRAYYHSWVVHQTDSKKLLSNYYTQSLRDRVYKLYEIDFDRFKYRRALPVV